ncbi:MAG: hypothetical protein CXT71_08185 [Methanobacteriota archaeon]|nr:MAG: hypothetical protein CXT71_08185 [Euryarchaeota archaeon]
MDGHTEDVSQLTRPPPVIRLENLTNEQEHYVCLFISDIRGNELILGPNNATPTINLRPNYAYNGTIGNQEILEGEDWIINLCDYFNDVETSCTDLIFSFTPDDEDRIIIGKGVRHGIVEWRPAGGVTKLLNLTFIACDEKGLCEKSEKIDVELDQQGPSGGKGESGGYSIDLPLFGETEVSLDSVVGIVGSAFLGIVTVLITVMRFRRSRSGKKRVSQIIKEIRITKNESSLDDLLDEATRLYTKDKINTEDYSLIDGHIEKRKVVLMRDAVAPSQLSPPGASPSIDAKGEVRPDGYEWLEHPVGNGVWWYRVPGANSWGKWDD